MEVAVIGGLALVGLTLVSVLSQSEARRPEARAQVNAVLIGLCVLAVLASIVWSLSLLI